MTALRIAVLGYVVRGPLGGLAWHHLQYVLGLRNLGHDVYFFEDSGDYPSCYDPRTDVTATDPSFGLEWTRRVFDRLAIGDRWAYYDAHADRWHGPRAGDAVRTCRSADVLINVSGMNTLRPWLGEVPVRAFVDTDPAFTQIRHLTDARARATAAAHTVHFSFGEGIEAGTATVPDDGLRWLATRQPIVLDAWRATPLPWAGRWTTVMAWEPYPSRLHAGVLYGTKSASFHAYLELPRRLRPALELAIGSDAATRHVLRTHGWRIRPALEPTRDPWAYQAYIRGSRGEWSVAKAAYVQTRSGWFSERSAAYLASGRPVVTEDTGWGAHIPAGEGALRFSNADEAAAALETVERDPQRHASAARELAAEWFDARRVLPRLLERAATAA